MSKETKTHQGGKKMKNKSILTTIFVLTFTVIFLSSSAFAGSKQRHRWEGVAIGMGAALLGGAVVHHYKHAVHSGPSHVTVRHAHPHRYKKHRIHRGHEYKSRGYRSRAYPHPGYRHRGHWKVVRAWDPPTYKRIWNPGHYNRHGDWIEGHWIRVVDQPGCWSEKRIWVSRW